MAVALQISSIVIFGRHDHLDIAPRSKVARWAACLAVTPAAASLAPAEAWKRLSFAITIFLCIAFLGIALFSVATPG